MDFSKVDRAEQDARKIIDKLREVEAAFSVILTRTPNRRGIVVKSQQPAQDQFMSVSNSQQSGA